MNVGKQESDKFEWFWKGFCLILDSNMKTFEALMDSVRISNAWYSRGILVICYITILVVISAERDEKFNCNGFLKVGKNIEVNLTWEKQNYEFYKIVLLLKYKTKMVLVLWVFQYTSFLPTYFCYYLLNWCYLKNKIDWLLVINNQDQFEYLLNRPWSVQMTIWSKKPTLTDRCSPIILTKSFMFI